MTLRLRDYQREAIEAVWERIKTHQTALVVASTGLGKTEILMGLIEKSINLFPQFRCIFLVNKINLLEQTVRRLSEKLPGVPIGAWYGQKRTLHTITVATIQSIHKLDLSVNMLILDECHNVNHNDGRYSDFIARSSAANPKLKIVAVTATPFRADGMIYGEGKLFSEVTFDRGLLWAQREGYLVRAKLKHSPEKFDVSGLRIRMGEYLASDVARLTSDETKLLKQIEDALPQLEGRKRVVWATSSIAHCELVASRLRIVGETVEVVHSKQKSEESIESIRRFESGESRHLVFVSIVSEGYDHPPIDAVVIMRPTRSPVLYVQTVGRGLRPCYEPGMPLGTADERLAAIEASNKRDCLVLDYGGVIENLGPLHAPRVREKNSSKGATREILMKFCPSCLEYCEIHVKQCHACKHLFVTATREASLKNLEKRSFRGEIDGSTEHRVLGVKILEHKSKSGRNCVRLDYTLSGLFPRHVSEYFVKDMAFSFARLRSRLSVFGINHFSDKTIGTTLLCGNKHIVIKIFKNKKGYHEVKSLESRDNNPE